MNQIMNAILDGLIKKAGFPTFGPSRAGHISPVPPDAKHIPRSQRGTDISGTNTSLNPGILDGPTNLKRRKLTDVAQY